MASYTQYKRIMSALDADDDNIETWITVKGNHIPIMKGQSKEEAVQAFIEKKGGDKKGILEASKGKLSEKEKREPATELVDLWNRIKPKTVKIINSSSTSSAKKESAPKTVAQLKKAAANLESSAAYHYERADRLSEMIKTREKEMESPHITPVMRKSIEKSIGELQLAISKHWVEAGKIEKAEREKQKSKPFNIPEPKTKEEARLWLADTLASTEGFTEANFSKEDKALLKKLDEKFGAGWWETKQKNKSASSNQPVAKKKVDGAEIIKSAEQVHGENSEQARKAREIYGERGNQTVHISGALSKVMADVDKKRKKQ